MKNTSEFAQEIIKLYNGGKSSLEIGKILNFSKCSILKCLERNGIKRRPLSEAKRKSNFNRTYFKVIDSEDKAYFLGLLYADGCNQEKRGVISIALQEEDVLILEKLKKYLEWDGEIRINNCNHKRFPHRKILREILITNKEFSNDLANLGCISNKSYNLKWPLHVKDKYISHFLRGYFDGDGSISKPETKIPKITIASTLEFCNSFNDYVERQLEINVQVFKYEKYTNNTGIIEISGRRQICLFLDWIYKDATVFLERKFLRYLGLKNKEVDNRGKTYHNRKLTINKEIQKQYATI